MLAKCMLDDHNAQGPYIRVCDRIWKSVHTVQLNLNFTHACRYTRVLAHLMRAKLKNWRVHALLHAILACTCRIANTRDTREMYITSLHLVCHTTRVV